MNVSSSWPLRYVFHYILQSPRLSLFREVIHRQRVRSQSFITTKSSSPNLRNDGKTYKLERSELASISVHYKNQDAESYNDISSAKVGFDETSLDENNNMAVTCMDSQTDRYTHNDPSTTSVGTVEAISEDTDSRMLHLLYESSCQDSVALSIDTMQTGLDCLLGEQTVARLTSDIETAIQTRTCLDDVLARVDIKHATVLPYILHLAQLRRFDTV